MSIITFGLEQLDDLKAKALAAPLKRARINLHEHLTDRVQEMVIAEHHTTYVRPHRHPGRLESFHIIEGSLTVVLFDDAGRVAQTVRLAARPLASFGVPVLYRQREPHWHTLLIESEFAVIHEVVEGPFPYETEWAPWAPEAADAFKLARDDSSGLREAMKAAAVEKYLDELRRKIQ